MSTSPTVITTSNVASAIVKLVAVDALPALMDAAEVLAMQETVKQIKVDESLLDYALDIVERTRTSEQLSLGVSPRGVVMLHRAAQARAFLEGRDYCLPDDFKRRSFRCSRTV